MRCRPVLDPICLCLILLTLAVIGPSPAVADDDGDTSNPATLVTGTANGDVQLVTLGPGGEFTRRTFRSAAGSLADSSRPPVILATGPGRGLIIWSRRGDQPGRIAAHFVIRDGVYHETWVGIWQLRGWSPTAAADLDHDGDVDLVLTKYDGVGDARRFSYRVAPGRADGSVDLRGRLPRRLVARCRGAYLVLADMDGDGLLDLVWHSYGYGGSYSTKLQMLFGLGDARFSDPDHAAVLLTSPHAATGPVVADFVGDGEPDVFLPPDDDVADVGQCHLALNSGDGSFAAVRESVDLRPDVERGDPDSFYGFAQAADVDGDGQADLLTRSLMVREQRYEFRWYRGHGDGLFADDPTTLGDGSYATRPVPPMRAIPAARANEPDSADADTDAAPVPDGDDHSDDAGLWFGLAGPLAGASLEPADRMAAGMAGAMQSGGAFVDVAAPMLTLSRRVPRGSAAFLRCQRAIAVLENLGSDAAFALLQQVVDKGPHESIRNQAEDALVRRARRIEQDEIDRARRRARQQNGDD